MHAEKAGFAEMLSAGLVSRLTKFHSVARVMRFVVKWHVRLTAPADVAKNVVVYTFAARTFTEFKSWKTVPLKR